MALDWQMSPKAIPRGSQSPKLMNLVALDHARASFYGLGRPLQKDPKAIPGGSQSPELIAIVAPDCENASLSGL